eukprot:CAMPEP_0177629590 /NCGR_PEP_ID=MMETSP0447-20121125/751_1 /TAXON_ID=0 /ORGANISM="Stygamoeba regulata, Strain BSH-02190019" /LENGTH=101 /DNA_ID=CAMNT_0019130925 /DNA_START=88 /DNA_END=393 /DNA_ORIENTATION=-
MSAQLEKPATDEVSKDTKPTQDADPNASKWVTDEEMTYYPLSRLRRVSVSHFRGKQLVNIREYYSDASGEIKPGRKGISLTVEQYEALKEAIPAIDRTLNL